MKHKNMLLVSLLMASLVLLGGCQSRTLTTQDPEPVVGESVVEPDPEPVQPVEQEPQIPDNAPGFYTTRQEMNGWEVFSLSTAQDLIDLSDWVQGGEDTAGRIFVLEDNIDLGGVDFVPIGTRENPFRGAFLGRGYSVTGLSVTVPDYGASAGLFGHLSYATIDSLQVSGTVTACHWAGGLVGYAKGSTIENCSFTGSVNGVLSDIGGLCGAAYASEFYSCTAGADVTGQESLGGFAGTLGQDSLVQNCAALGTVSAAGREHWLEEYGLPEPDWGTQPDTEIMVRYIGGFAGMNIGTLENCLSMGAVKTLEVAKSAGGFVGYESGSDTGCYYFMDYNAHWEPGYAVGDYASLTAQGLYYDRMASRSSFAGWDFDAVWQMGERHPELIIQDPMTAEIIAGAPDPTAGLEGESAPSTQDTDENREVG